MSEEFKFEVAFSFLQQDESTVNQINDLLRERLATFVYSERQLDLVGKNGEVLLKNVFGAQARIVVILYNKGWGTTPWTRIEQDAIRDRAYDHGYDFCLLIPLDEQPLRPEWYPRTRIWLGLKRWGIEAAAAIIEARVEEAGGTAREETLAERTERLQRKIQAAKKRQFFLSSEKAIKPADEEARRLYSRLEETIPGVSNKEIPLAFKREQEGGVSISSYGFVLKVYWHRRYTNVLIDSGLYIHLIEIDRDDDFERKYHEICKLEFDFDLIDVDEYGWRARFDDKKFYSTTNLADFLFKMIIDRVSDYRLKELAKIR